MAITLPASGTGTATPIAATEAIATEHYQLIKIVDGVAASTTKLKVVAEDEALAGGEGGLLLMAQRKATPADNSGTDGDAEYLQMSGGALWVRPHTAIIRCQTDVTRPADTAVYAAADAISDSTTAPTAGGFTFTGAARKSGGSGIIIAATFASSNDPATRLAGELFIFDQAVTNINDNAAFVVSDAEIKTIIAGVIPFSLFDAGNNGFCAVNNLAIPFVCVGSANLRFLLRARNAYTPASAEVITCTLYIQPGD